MPTRAQVFNSPRPDANAWQMGNTETVAADVTGNVRLELTGSPVYVREIADAKVLGEFWAVPDEQPSAPAACR